MPTKMFRIGFTVLSAITIPGLAFLFGDPRTAVDWVLIAVCSVMFSTLTYSVLKDFDSDSNQVNYTISAGLKDIIESDNHRKEV